MNDSLKQPPWSDGIKTALGEDAESTRATDNQAFDDEMAAAADELSADHHVPMLTDVVQIPRYQSADLPERLDEVNWTQLSERVRDNVMERLMRKSTQLLEERMADTLQVIIERATDNLNLELRDALSSMIKEIVAKAVDEELNRVHTEITRRSTP